MKIIETERLLLRYWRNEDAEDLFQLNQDKEVMKFTGDVPFKTTEDAERLIKNYTHYTNYGYGRLAVIEKSTGYFIGWCGLKYTPEQNVTDIGFRFYKKFWNRGFATEAAIACISDGFKTYHLNKIIGRVMNENIASVKVLQKCNLKFETYFDFDGQPGSIYAINNPYNNNVCFNYPTWY